MKHELGKVKMKATESAPMPTKQKNDGKVLNQTTDVPRNRFPWTTIFTVAAILLLIAIVVLFLEVGSR